MLAVQAKYENGTVRWERNPPVHGMHDLIVIFSDVSDTDGAGQETSSSHVCDENAENEDHRVWSGYSLGNLDAAYGNDEPDYTDAMVKAPNPEFAP